MFNPLHSILNQKAPLQSTHTKRNGAKRPIYINYRLKSVKYPLCFVVSYVQPVTQQYESRTVRKAPLQSK